MGTYSRGEVPVGGPAPGVGEMHGYAGRLLLCQVRPV